MFYFVFFIFFGSVLDAAVVAEFVGGAKGKDHLGGAAAVVIELISAPAAKERAGERKGGVLQARGEGLRVEDIGHGRLVVGRGRALGRQSVRGHGCG